MIKMRFLVIFAILAVLPLSALCDLRSRITDDIKSLERDVAAMKQTSPDSPDSSSSHEAFLGTSTNRWRDSSVAPKRANRFMHGSFDPELYSKKWHRRYYQVQSPNCCCRGCDDNADNKDKKTSKSASGDKGSVHRVKQPWRVSCADVCGSGKFSSFSEDGNYRSVTLKCSESEYDGCSRIHKEERLNSPDRSVLEPMTSHERLIAAKACGTSKRCLFVRADGQWSADYMKITIQRNFVSKAISKLTATFGDAGRIGKHWGETQHLYKGDTAVFALEDDEQSVNLAISAMLPGNIVDERRGEAYCAVSTTPGKESKCKRNLNFNEGITNVLNSVQNVLRGTVYITTFAV